ncbi:MAG: DUF1062 domain-containing protein [Chryseobacterium sp.]|uniref:DUF1062 domain-containing protein n=1 Tax=Chryseobacterium sp. TaxID=1871047 RepID=UPI0025C0657E|nr:DUF1062 domain-containing protein [Chryseobacterium sp.]MCJ7935748.1 DUF1062 domain-containing protein [Chryseobacterium sp.]
MNAQKKNIDIWLIYRCIKCKNTYNMTLFSRTRKESISKDLFSKFSENNAETAWHYAFSLEMRRKNNVEPDAESVEYDIRYPPVEEILNFDHEEATFTIKYPFEFNLRVSSVVRIGLSLSARQLNRLLELNAISFQQKPLQKKHKVKNGDIVKVNIEKLRSIRCENPQQ